jgi:hypothetical protein
MREFSRISKPGGNLCVIYNDRKKTGRFMRAYQGFIRRNKVASITDLDKTVLPLFFDSGRYSRHTVANKQVLDFQGLLGRFLSSSYMPPPQVGEGLTRFKEDVRLLFDTYSKNGKVTIPYDTRLFIGPVGG